MCPRIDPNRFNSMQYFRENTLGSQSGVVVEPLNRNMEATISESAPASTPASTLAYAATINLSCWANPIGLHTRFFVDQIIRERLIYLYRKMKQWSRQSMLHRAWELRFFGVNMGSFRTSLGTELHTTGLNSLVITLTYNISRTRSCSAI